MLNHTITRSKLTAASLVAALGIGFAAAPAGAAAAKGPTKHTKTAIHRTGRTIDVSSKDRASKDKNSSRDRSVDA